MAHLFEQAGLTRARLTGDNEEPGISIRAQRREEVLSAYERGYRVRHTRQPSLGRDLDTSLQNPAFGLTKFGPRIHPEFDPQRSPAGVQERQRLAATPEAG